MSNETPTHYVLHTADDSGAARPLVILVTGQHGDEAEGVLLGQWLTRAYLEARTLGGRRGYDLAVFGAVNSWGLARGERMMADGRDSNRCHGGPSAPVLPWEPELWALAAAAPRALVLDLHAHYDPHAVYVAAGTEDAVRALFPTLPLKVKSDPGILRDAALAAGHLSVTVEAARSRHANLRDLEEAVTAAIRTWVAGA